MVTGTMPEPEATGTATPLMVPPRTPAPRAGGPPDGVPPADETLPDRLLRGGRPSAYRAAPATPDRRTRAARKRPRHPAAALPLLVCLALVAAFFGWQSAAPLWLAFGFGTPGTATATWCEAADRAPVAEPSKDRPAYPCVVFTAADAGPRVVDVTLRGVGAADLTPGTRLPARMLAVDGDIAYAGSTAGLHLRWSLGWLLVLACGAGIAWATGATRLHGERVRWRAVLLSFAGPVLIATGFLAAAAP